MKKTSATIVAMCGALLAGASAADAQSVTAPKMFVNVNGGAQPQRRDISNDTSFPIYDETATLTTKSRVTNGAFYQVEGGYRVWGELTLGVGVSYFMSKGTASTQVSIPDPIVFSTPQDDHSRKLTVDSKDLTHKEVGVHIRASWFFPVTDKIDVAISVGPSIFKVTQDFITADKNDVPTGTQNINLRLVGANKTAVGVNASFDGSYMLTPKYGVGLLLQYAGGKATFPLAEDVSFGGLQAGVGFRARF